MSLVLLGTPVIGVAFLHLGCDGSAALGAVKQSHERFRGALGLLGRPAPATVHDGLYFIEHLLGNQWLVFAFGHFAGITEVAVVERVGEYLRNVGADKELAVLRADTAACEEFPKRVKGCISGGVHFKGLPHDRSAFAIHDDSLGAVVVEVAERCGAGELAAAYLFPKTALGVLGKRIDVVFALAEHEVEHELALRVGFKAEGREFQVPDLPEIEQVNDLAAVNAVAGQTVGMPGEDAVGLAGFDAGEHVVENGTARVLGRLLLDEFGHDRQVFAFGELPKLGELGVDGQDLLVLNIGRFAGVKKEGVHGDCFCDGTLYCARIPGKIQLGEGGCQRFSSAVFAVLSFFAYWMPVSCLSNAWSFASVAALSSAFGQLRSGISRIWLGHCSVMVQPMEPSLTTIKRLFAASSNRCAFPKCCLPIVEESGTVTGIICHIKARSDGGPRYDSKQSDVERHGFNNLVLMCARHSKQIDSEPKTFTVALLREIKEMHERSGSIDLRAGDAKKSERLLADYRKHYNIDAGGHVMIDSPGGIQAETVTINTARKTVRLNAPAGSIAADRLKRNYVKHLIDRYHEFASQQPGRLFSYPAIYAEIKKSFGAKWDYVSLDSFERLNLHLQRRIDRTMRGSINRGKGQRNYSTFEEFARKYEVPRSK